MRRHNPLGGRVSAACAGPCRSLSGRFTLHLVAAIALAFALTSGLGAVLVGRARDRARAERLSETARDLSARLSAPLARADDAAVAAACEAFAVSGVADFLRVVDAAGRPVFVRGEAGPSAPALDLPIVRHGAVIGRIQMAGSAAAWREEVVGSLVLNVATAIAVILALLASSLFARERLRRPLEQLASLLDRLSLGHYPDPTPALAFREFSPIVASFERMAERVRLGETTLVESNERLRAEAARREESAAALQSLLDAVPVGVAMVERRTLRRVNERFSALTGYAPEELLGARMRIFYGDGAEYERVGDTLYRSARETGRGAIETTWRRKDGSPVEVLVQVTGAMPERDGTFTLTVTDLTDQRRAAIEREALHERLARTQKLEAIGTLAGGIAHDFNNILGAILGYTEFCLKHEALTPELRDDLQVVRQAGRRASDLVRQILTFSRQASQERIAVQPRLVAAEALKLLRASLPATIEIRPRLDCAANVLADPAQLHQILVNLCTNAALAMKERGGVLEVELSESGFDEAEARLEGVEPQGFVRLTVRDTGCGMTREVQERIFEPFFTTRPEGEGTGMGLAVVHGIVRASGGYITVRSAPGTGSTFDVFLPIALTDAAVGEAADEAPAAGDERVLLVDDEPLLVEVAQRALALGGYAVTAHVSSREAIRAFEEAPDAWDVIVTDMTMPGVTGEELVRRVRALRPDLPIVLCSGFSEEMTPERVARLGIDLYALKPVTPAGLRRLVRSAVDGRRRSAA